MVTSIARLALVLVVGVVFSSLAQAQPQQFGGGGGNQQQFGNGNQPPQFGGGNPPQQFGGGNQPQQIPVEPFPQVLAEWNQLDQQITDTAQQYRSATDPNQREQFRNQYMQLLGSSRGVLERLRVAGEAVYQQAPNTNPEVTRTLIGIASNYIRGDDYISAANLGKLLIEKGCNDPPLWDLTGKAAYCVDDFEGAELLLRRAEQAGAIDDAGKGYLAEMPMQKPKWAAEVAIRNQEEAANDLPRVLLKTSKGDIWLELFENDAPQTVGNFISLVDKGFYDGLTFHRVLAGFMAQGGCPEGSGAGGPGYNIYDEINRRYHFMGALSMAKSAAPNTAGSQFFMTFRATPHLDGKHTVFGRVIAGFDVLCRLQRIEVDPSRPSRNKPDTIIQASVKRRRPQSVYQPNIVPGSVK